MELYHQMSGQQELYALIDEGLDSAKNGRVRPYKEAMADIRKGLQDNDISSGDIIGVNCVRPQPPLSLPP